MTFSAQLSRLMREMNCSASQLSKVSGVPRYTISKYCSGSRCPKEDSEVVTKLANGLRAVALEQDLRGYLDTDIAGLLHSAARFEAAGFDYAALIRNMKLLVQHFGITITEIARETHYHRSTLYSLLQGKTKLREPEAFTEFLAQYVVKRFGGMHGQMQASALIGWSSPLFDTKADYLAAITLWLSGKYESASGDAKEQLAALDRLDLNEYHRHFRFDNVSLSKIPMRLTRVKEYIGPEGMEAAIADFIKISSTSKSYRDLIIYSSFPVKHLLIGAFASATAMAEGLNLIMQKGICIKSIHSLEHPIDEVAEELNFWLPLLMSGLVHSLYVEENTSFDHCLIASGTAVLRGSCVKGDYDSAYFRLFTDPNDVIREYHAAEVFASRAMPLTEVYTKSEKDAFSALRNHDSMMNCRLRELLSAPPIYTISEALLSQILSRHHITAAQDHEIRAHVQQERERVDRLLANNELHACVARFSSREFRTYPVRLNLSAGMLETELFYTFEEYLQHIQETLIFEQAHTNYRFYLDSAVPLRNIQVALQGDAVLISKSKFPVTHFVVRKDYYFHAISEMIDRYFQNPR